MPSILTVRLSKAEEEILAARCKRLGIKKATLIRRLICEDEIVTGADLIAWGEQHLGDQRLRISKRP